MVRPFLIAAVILASFVVPTRAVAAEDRAAEDLAAEQGGGVVPLIFDTDIGNDVDDALALAVIHSLESRGECKLLAVTITKDHESAASFTDAVNTFYGRGDVPIGVCRSGVTPEEGRFIGLAGQDDDGQLRYPHDLRSGADAVDAVTLLRQTLATSDNHSVVIAQVGFSTNLANLIASTADEVSPLSGLELVRQKVRLLSVMAGAFRKIKNGKTGELHEHREYNVIKDLPSAHRLFGAWPTPIVWSGYEIGRAVPYPSASIDRHYNYVSHHPVAEAYGLYCAPGHNRPTWDLTSVLYAVRPNEDYFDISANGQVTVDAEGYTTFEQAADGRDRYLILRDDQKGKTAEALVQLSSQPPSR